MAREPGTVYVIDDDESVRKSFERLFRSANMEVKTFSSPADFLDEPLIERKSCIIIDIRMPGITGFDLQARLTTRKITTPVIVVSASDDAQARETAKKLGAISYFRKPVDDQALLDAIYWAISTADNA
jgi:FixJ family two-component response regulator